MMRLGCSGGFALSRYQLRAWQKGISSGIEFDVPRWGLTVGKATLCCRFSHYLGGDDSTAESMWREFHTHGNQGIKDFIGLFSSSLARRVISRKRIALTLPVTRPLGPQSLPAAPGHNRPAAPRRRAARPRRRRS